MLIHCFNHRLELAMKDAFSGTLFGENNIMLRRCLDHSLDESSKQLTNFTKSLKQVTDRNWGIQKYQEVTLQYHQASLNALWNNYKEFISKINERVKWRFSELQNSPIFANLPIILDCKKWPQTNEQLMSFGDGKIENLKVHFMPLLEKYSCEIESIMFEWDHLKVEIIHFQKLRKIT